MEFQEHRDNDILTIAVKGSLNANTSPTLEKRLLDLLDAGERRLLLDFTSLDYISSAGLRAIQVVARRLGGNRGKLVLAGPSKSVRQVFAVSGLGFLVQMTETIEEAKAFLRTATA
jgi:anti-anti-sigma factor